MIIVAAVAIAIVAIAVVTASRGRSANADVTATVVKVVALDGSDIRISIDWHNSGGAAGGADCVMTTNVYDRAGHQVTSEVNEAGTNGNLAAGATQHVHEDIGVQAGDAPFVKVSDISFTNC